MSCEPPYRYRPSVPPRSNSNAPVYREHRSRRFTGGTYFRSIKQSSSWNDISLVVTNIVNDFELNVKFQGAVVETYNITVVPDMMSGGNDGISKLRTATAGSAYIEMYPRGSDKEYDKNGVDGIGLDAFPETYMAGGSGGPVDARGLAKINTGQDRTLIIVSTREKQNGDSTSSRKAGKVMQWNGVEWTKYANSKQGSCPIIGSYPSIFGGRDEEEDAAYFDLIIADAPVSYWRLGESSGIIAVDQMGVNDGAYGNAPTLGATSLVPSESDTAVTFNGSNEDVVIPHSTTLNFGGGDQTVEFWLNAADANQGCSLVQKRMKAGPFSHWAVGIGSDAHVAGSGKTIFASSHASFGDEVEYITTNNVIDGGTHYVVCVWDATVPEIRIYVDGSEAATTLLNNTGTMPNVDNTDTAAIAASNADVLYFNGTMDEVAVYGKILTAQQISDHYDAGIG